MPVSVHRILEKEQGIELWKFPLLYIKGGRVKDRIESKGNASEGLHCHTIWGRW